MKNTEKKIKTKKDSKTLKINIEDLNSLIIKQKDTITTSIRKKESNVLDKSKIKNLEEKLNKEIIGQDSAIKVLVNTIKRSYLDLGDRQNKPKCSLLFLGPTGVGKTQTAKSLALHLLSDKEFLRVDMSDYSEKHNVSRLIGSPPGYIGYGDPGILTKHIKNNPNSVIVFDEIEKAHSDVLNILLQILEEGEIRSGEGEIINLRNSYILLTSNIGANVANKETIGFNNTSFDIVQENKKNIFIKELKKTIKPEILNRLDDFLVYQSISKKDALKILEKNLKNIINKIESKHNLVINISDNVKNYLLEKGFSLEYGVRELNRSIEKNLLNLISNHLLSNFSKKNNISIELKKGIPKINIV